MHKKPSRMITAVGTTALSNLAGITGTGPVTHVHHVTQ